MRDKREHAIRRKTWAFYTVQICVCLPAAYFHEVTWPLAALSGGVYLFYVAAIAAEKIMLGMINKGCKFGSTE